MTAAATLVFRSGRVLALDDADTRGTAIALTGDRVLAVGSDAEIDRLTRPDTVVRALDGATVIPGFNDAHAHMDREGLKEIRPSLADCRSVADILEKVRALAAAAAPGDWIVTMPVGWPPHYFDGLQTLAERRMPTRAELDAAAPRNPVYIPGLFGNWGRPPGHAALNSEALRLNGITRDSRPRLKGVEIERDATGEPTGVIVEHNPRPTVEFDLLKAVPRFGLADRTAGLKRSMAIYNAVGTTSVYEGHGCAPETIAAYRNLWERGEMTVRATLVASPTWADLAEARTALRDWFATARGRGLGDPWLRVSGIHIAYGGDPLLAALARADLPNTGWSGFVEQAVSKGEFRDYCFLMAENDLRLNTIVSDQLHEVVPVLEEVNARFPLAGRRWVIQHIARARRADLERLKALQVEVTTIPVYFLWKGGHWYLDESDGGNGVVAHRDMLEMGLPFAAATDNIPYDPLFTLWSMVERRDRVTARAIGPGQGLTSLQALRALTVAGARLSFEEGVKGPLSPGRFADLCVLTHDPTVLAGDDLFALPKVLSTVVGGREVFGR